ncbi:MAG: WecB/TagA/CpsF family glycosyltransferase [Marinilabiliales bacterium]
MKVKQVNIIDCPCTPYKSVNEAKEQVLQLLKDKQGGYTVAINALKINQYHKDNIVKSIIDNAVIQVPDGFGAVYGLKLLHKINTIKLDMPGLILDIANEYHYKVFFLGTNEENNKLAVDNVKNNYPGIVIAGRNNGFFNDLKEIKEKLAFSLPDIVMIAMGSPKQELISAELVKDFPKILFIGCGGRLDIIAGKLKRAPEFYIKWNIEWFYRLIKQPKRIKQQIRLISFLIMLYKYHWFKEKHKI